MDFFDKLCKFFTSIGETGKEQAKLILKTFPNVMSEDTADYQVALNDLVAFFQSYKLNKETDIPIMAKSTSKAIAALKIKEKEGYETLFLCVYNKVKDSIEVAKVLHAKSFADDVKQVFGKEDFITLS